MNSEDCSESDVEIVDSEKCFRNACRAGRLAAVKYLAVQHGPALKPRAAAMLAISLGRGHSEVVKFIIDHFRLDVNVKILDEEYKYDPEYTGVTIVHRRR